MNNIKTIRERLGLTQAALAEGMGCTQGNVGHYERGQTVPPDAARSLIAFAGTKGLEVSFDDIYGPEPKFAEQKLAQEVFTRANGKTVTDQRAHDQETKASAAGGLALVSRRKEKTEVI